MPENAVGCHEKFQLFVGLIADAVIHHGGQGNIRLINKTENTGPGLPGFCHCLYNLGRCAGDRGNDDERPGPDSAVSCSTVFCRIGDEQFESTALFHVAMCLHAACPGSADPEPAQIRKSAGPDAVYDFLDLCAQGESPAHTVYLLLFIELKQEGSSFSISPPSASGSTGRKW